MREENGLLRFLRLLDFSLVYILSGVGEEMSMLLEAELWGIGASASWGSLDTSRLHAATARAIARQVGLENPDDVLTGAELDRLDDAELLRRVNEVDV